MHTDPLPNAASQRISQQRVTVSKTSPWRGDMEKCGFRCVGCRMGEETERGVAREIADHVLE